MGELAGSPPFGDQIEFECPRVLDAVRDRSGFERDLFAGGRDGQLADGEAGWVTMRAAGGVSGLGVVGFGSLVGGWECGGLRGWRR